MINGNFVKSIKCSGSNCSAIRGGNHSIECHVEHNKAVYSGARKRHKEDWYAGYSGQPLRKNATADQSAAWWKGFADRQNN